MNKALEKVESTDNAVEALKDETDFVINVFSRVFVEKMLGKLDADVVQAVAVAYNHARKAHDLPELPDNIARMHVENIVASNRDRLAVVKDYIRREKLGGLIDLSMSQVKDHLGKKTPKRTDLATIRNIRANTIRVSKLVNQVAKLYNLVYPDGDKRKKQYDESGNSVNVNVIFGKVSEFDREYPDRQSAIPGEQS